MQEIHSSKQELQASSFPIIAEDIIRITQDCGAWQFCFGKVIFTEH